MLLHYLAKSENPIYSCFPSSSHIFFISPSLWPPNSPDLNPVDYAVWGILQEHVYKHHRITDVEDLYQRVEEEWDCMHGRGSDWQRDQWMTQATDSLHCSRRVTFWNSLWTLLHLFRYWLTCSELVKSFIRLTRSTILNYSKTTRKQETSFYILTTGTGSQSWWRLPTWSRNVDKQYVSWLL